MVLGQVKFLSDGLGSSEVPSDQMVIPVSKSQNTIETPRHVDPMTSLIRNHLLGLERKGNETKG
jgi:hypothetical protein